MLGSLWWSINAIVGDDIEMTRWTALSLLRGHLRIVQIIPLEAVDLVEERMYFFMFLIYLVIDVVSEECLKILSLMPCSSSVKTQQPSGYLGVLEKCYYLTNRHQ